MRLDLVDADGNAKETWGFDGGCVFPDREQRRLQIIQNNGNGMADAPTSAPTLAELVSDCPLCPVCSIKEDGDIKYFRIIREPSEFAWDLLVRLQLIFLEDTVGDGFSSDDFDFDRFDNSKSWQQKYERLFYGNRIPDYIIGGTSSNTITIPYALKVDDDAEDEQEKVEAFRVDINSCEVDDSSGAQHQLPDALQGEYICEPGKYSSVIISIEPEIKGGAFTSTTEGDLPLWIWAPVGFAAVAIPVVAYLIWRFYNAKKIADAMEIQRKHELQETEKQDDVGDFGIVGDNVRANPLATGDAFEIPKGDAIIDHALAVDKANFEVASPDVEHNIFKEDFGPVQPERHNLD